MTEERPSRATLVLKIAGAVAVIGASKALFRASPGIVARHGTGETPADDGAHSRRSDLITYSVGYLLALALTCIAFAVVHWRWASGATALGIVFALALVQAIVHFRCFLHITMQRASRHDLQLILFSTLIIVMMVGGTLVLLMNLRGRMM